jgi:hypothetical protein
MTNIIAINENTREFIGAVLNEGVVPEIEEFNTYFAFENDRSVPARILDPVEYLNRVAAGDWKKSFMIEVV